jgi:hypothetical protein
MIPNSHSDLGSSSHVRARRVLRALAATALAALAPAAAQRTVEADTSYSYVRSLEGRATLASLGRGPGEEADVNQPLMQGDTLRADAGSRVELALADRTLLRVGGGTTVTLARIAFSADRDDRTTRLELEEGEILLLVGEDALGDELPEVHTAAGTIYVHEPGEYRVTAETGGGLELVVREGYAELLTERGSTVVRAGEAAWTEGQGWSRVEVVDAGAHDTLERWGDDLDQQAEVAEPQTQYVEPQYRYAAAPLTNYGSWVYVDSAWSWRPRVTADWRPYWNGRWAWTPSGLTWVSAEPWGWLPYHYGSWYQAPGFGWCWRPGRIYSPAWVYWHVGPRWTGWCPVGYYTNYYRNHWSNGFRFGLYGWAGGNWGYYSDWNFCPTPRVYDRYDRHWRHTGDHVGRLADSGAPYGLLTTETSGLERGDWMRGDMVVTKLGRRAGNGVHQLPQVTDFVARKRELTPEVEHAVVAERRGGQRLATPLDPQVAESGGDRASPGWRAHRSGTGAVRVAGGRGDGGTQPIEYERDRGRALEDGSRAPRVRTGGTNPTAYDRDRVLTRPLDEPERHSGGTRPIEYDRDRGRPIPPIGDGTDDRRRWQQGTPYAGGGAGRVVSGSAGRTGSPRAVPGIGGSRTGTVDPRYGASGGDRYGTQPVARVIDGVRRGAPEVGTAPGSKPEGVAPPTGGSSSRPSYRVPVQPPYSTVRPSPGGPTARSQPTTPGQRSSPPTVSAPRSGGPSRGTAPQGSRGGSGSSGRSGSSASSGSGGSTTSSDSTSSGSSGGGDSPPGQRGGGSKSPGRDR